MIKWLSGWFCASLVMPAMVMLFGRWLNQYVVLLFWPGSISLLSLGGQERYVTEIVYVFSIAIGLNI